MWICRPVDGQIGKRSGRSVHCSSTSVARRIRLSSGSAVPAGEAGWNGPRLGGSWDFFVPNPPDGNGSLWLSVT